ncbi:MAG: sodium:calcium antiporter [Gammaproteobacteria bacterium]
MISLIVGSQYAVVCAENIAKLLNISELIIGLTIIAIGTSLPELAATISAILKKKTNMIVGNVIGSNVLNIVLVVPIIGIFSNVLLEENLFFRDYFSMIFATIAFICAVIIFSSKLVNLFTIRLAGIFLVLSYFIYILNLSGLI